MSKLESPLPILSYWAETDSCVSSHHTLAARLFCLCVCALIDLQIAPPSRLTGLLWERCLPSETLISAGSSINLLSKHRVLWWKPCCLTPRLYRITTVRTVRAEEALSLCFVLFFPLLLRPWLFLPSCSPICHDVLSLKSSSQFEHVLAASQGRAEATLQDQSPYWHLQWIPAIRWFPFLQITESTFCLQGQTGIF